jgi:hypothetical protein
MPARKPLLGANKGGGGAAKSARAKIVGAVLNRAPARCDERM